MPYNLAFGVEKPFDQDEIFHPDSPYNRDDCLAWVRNLKNFWTEHAGECHTIDWFRNQSIRPDVVLYFEIPPNPIKEQLSVWSPKPKATVILTECEAIVSRNWQIDRHNEYDLIFTWHDELLQTDPKYRRWHFPVAWDTKVSKEISFHDRKFCTMIAGNKLIQHPDELYSKRLEAIRWFEKNHPDEFDLFGTGWDRDLSLQLLGIQKIWKKWFDRTGPFPSYRGTIARKHEVLGQYRFSICYENVKDIPGYITEKIMDCFIAECIPIYWGASNISSYLPEECYIDRRKFAEYESLYGYLQSIDQARFDKYILSIREFRNNSKSSLFCAK